ncbi:MAG: molybdate ABC transporter substrate-binding protein [Cyclobacteriaceae bacterium]
MKRCRWLNKIRITILFSCALLCSCQDNPQSKLTIATAANMQFAMKELTASFIQETGVECETVNSSSGKLTAQIKEGAPFDILVSADMKYPSELFESGFAISTPKVYAHGRLVLWSMTGQKPSLESLTDEDVSHIALANPKIAPYGSAALEVLEHYGILTKVESKVVYGESIAQTNQFVISKAAEMGFTAKSAVLSPEMEGQGQWIEIDTSIYTPLAQGVVILKNRSSHLDQAQKFYDFLFSQKGKEILDKFGYSVF